jgi:hypothetical protein
MAAVDLFGVDAILVSESGTWVEAKFVPHQKTGQAGFRIILKCSAQAKRVPARVGLQQLRHTSPLQKLCQHSGA